MTSDLRVSDLRLRLDPNPGRVPFAPMIEAMTVELSPAAFDKIVRAGLAMVIDRVPVEIQLVTADLVDGGAEIVTRVKRSILKAEVKARLGFESAGDDVIRIRVVKVDAPAWVPTQFVLDQGLSVMAARPGFSNAEGEANAIDIRPAELLARRGLPLTLAQPGAWRIDPRADLLTLAFEATG